MTEDNDDRSSFTIRPGSKDDCCHLALIEEQADVRYFDTRLAELGPSDGIPEEVALRYCARDQLLVAEVVGEIVGFIVWHREPDPSYLGIGQVSVLPAFGRRGIGAALLAGATDQVGDGTTRFISLATFTDIPWNDRWYQSLGYRVVRPIDQTDWMREVVTEQEAAGLSWDDRVWMVRELS